MWPKHERRRNQSAATNLFGIRLATELSARTDPLSHMLYQIPDTQRLPHVVNISDLCTLCRAHRYARIHGDEPRLPVTYPPPKNGEATSSEPKKTAKHTRKHKTSEKQKTTPKNTKT